MDKLKYFVPLTLKPFGRIHTPDKCWFTGISIVIEMGNMEDFGNMPWHFNDK